MFEGIDEKRMNAKQPAYTCRSFGLTPEGKEVKKFTLENSHGMTIQVITFGGIITSWTAPNREGAFANINLGFDELEPYLSMNPYFGALIGRYANRIAKGKFMLNGKCYTLEVNNAPNHLHGGHKSFDKAVWDAIPDKSASNVSLKLHYLSRDMEGGYPGNLHVTVNYTLTNENELIVDYHAVTDKPTVVNLTQHAYFNLSGDFSKSILDHEVKIDADQFLPVDKSLIPTGEFFDVSETPFDFRKSKAIGLEIGAENEQLKIGNGYDHCWVLNDPGQLRKVASAHHPDSGRHLDVFTDEPGMQLYSGNFLGDALPIPGGGYYGHHAGFCLETQHFPDSPNQNHFPSVVLNPEETYTSTTVYKLSIR